MPQYRISFVTFWKGISLVYSLISLLGIVYNKIALSYNVATTLSVHSPVHFLKSDRPRRRCRCRRAAGIWNSYLLTFLPLALFTFSTLQCRAGAPCPPIIVRSTIAISRDKHKLTIDSLINVINPAHYTHHVALHALTYVVTYWVINCNRANEFTTFL